MRSLLRFSSCRGVAFCVPHPDEEDEDESSTKAEYGDNDHGLIEDDLEKQASQSPRHLLAVSKCEPQPKVAHKKASWLSIILLHQGLFTVYKRLFVVCLALNITGLVLAATGHFPYARKRAALFSIANILTLTLCRSEAFLRVIFWLAVKLLGRSSVPLFMKTATTLLLQSLGGRSKGRPTREDQPVTVLRMAGVRHHLRRQERAHDACGSSRRLHKVVGLVTAKPPVGSR